MDKIYTIEIDSNLDSALKKFQNQLTEGEQIIHTASAGNKLIITTRESKQTRRNLLLEETRKGLPVLK